MMHKSTTMPWVRPPSTFIPAPELGRPPGGSSPVIHFFRDQETGSRWIGKLGQVPLRDKEVLEAARQMPGFLGMYADEILEKLGLAVYQLLGTEVPESALSYQRVTIEAMHPDMLLAMQLNAEDEGRDFELPHSPRMHYLSRYVEEFQPLDKEFVEHYLANAKRCGNEYVKIQTRDGEELPLRGLGSMLAAADFVYDLDCLGDSCGNAGYVIREDSATGERYAQLVKIDAGYAFSYSDLRTDQRHNPRDRQIRVAPNQLRLQFADLAPADQKEFAVTAKKILATPYEEFAHLFSQTEELNEGLAAHHWQQLLDELIVRKSLFLKAFAPETDRTIVKEIEAAQAKVAKKLEHTEEVSAQAVEEILAQEKEEAIALAELRVRLAVVDVKEDEPKKVGECKTFQLPSTNTHFVGREEALAQVVSQLSQANGSVIGQSISGIGGVGKTQLALRYAQAAASGECIAGQHLAYEYVVWLNAEMFLEGQFQAMAEVWTGEYLPAEEAVPAVYGFLRGKRTLLVFDNAENARSIEAFLPPRQHTGTVHLLITSRNAQWGEISTIKLGGFSLEEACEYVEFYLGSQPKEVVNKLLELVEGLPLAMSQAVSYIKAGHSTLEGFEEQFYLNQANLLSHDLIEEEAHPKTVGTTLTLCLAQAKVRSELAERLLGVAAYLAPEGIQTKLLAQVLEVNSLEIDQASKVLEGYSLMSIDGGIVQVHRLVQEVMRHRHKFLANPTSYWEKTLKLLKNVLIYNNTNLLEMRSCNYLIRHVQEFSKISDRCVLTSEQECSLAVLLEKSGLHQYAMGDYKASVDFLLHALQIKELNYGTDDIAISTTLNNLGNVYGRMGDAKKNKELLERALHINQTVNGGDSEELCSMLTSLANAYGDLGDFDKKRRLLEQALNICDRSYSSEHPLRSIILVNLANVYGALGNVRKQIELLQHALVVQKRIYGSNHPEVAHTLVFLANACGVLGNVRKKKELLEYALTINKVHYGVNHPEVAKVLASLGIVYGALGHYQSQVDLLEQALTIFKECYGESHPEVAKTLANLGLAFGHLGEFVKQKEMLEHALILEQEHYGRHHPSVAKTLNHLAVAYGMLGNVNKAKELLESALTINEILYGRNHYEVAMVLTNLGKVFCLLGNARKGKDMLERALSINVQSFGELHLVVATTLINLAQAYGALGDTRRQKEMINRAQKIRELCHSNNHSS